MIKKVIAYFEMIKIWHTIFALPFAFIGMLYSCDGEINWTRFIYIIIAMVSVRTVAMTFNRISDVRYDELNPRTSNRALVSGIFSINFAWCVVVFFSILFVYVCFLLNELAFFLSPVALFIVLIYSLTKRWTYLSHYVLGFSLSLAPAGGWIAMSGKIDYHFFPLMTAVLFWVAGFDIIYALLDTDFDKKIGLKSIPAKLGRMTALKISRTSHVLMIVSIVFFGIIQNVSVFFFLGTLVVAILILYEHNLAKRLDEKRINKAFFEVNAVISFLLLLSVLFDIYL